MADVTIPLRFQRQELREKAKLSDGGLRSLAAAKGPENLVATLKADDQPLDAISALALMLPRRQAVWWACLGTRLIPDLDQRPDEAAAVEAAENWVQSQAPEDAEKAQDAAARCAPASAAAYAALAAFWSGPSIAPRGQQAVAPAAHLPGVATRVALLLTANEPSVRDRIGFEDLLEIGLELMKGDLGRKAQDMLRARLVPA